MIDRTHLRNFLNSIPGLEGWSDSVEHLNVVEMVLEALVEPTWDSLNAGAARVDSMLETSASDYVAGEVWKAMWSARFRGE